MALINAINCVSGTDNTGLAACVFDPKEIMGSILIPSGTTISQTEIETAGGLSNFLIAKLNEDDKTKRYFLIEGFEEIEDNSEDATTETLGYGVERFIREGQYRMTFRFIKGGKCLHSKARSFSHQEEAYDVLFIDSQKAILGTQAMVDGEVHIKGYTLSQIYVPKMTFADGSTGAGYRITYSLAYDTEVNDTFAFVLPTDGDRANMNRLKGIIDVALVTPTTTTTGILDVTPLAGCGSMNLADLFGTELSVAGAWEVLGIGNAPISVTAFSVEQGVNGAFIRLTLDTTAPYPVAGGTITLALESPSALGALDIKSPNGSLLESKVIRILVTP